MQRLRVAPLPGSCFISVYDYIFSTTLCGDGRAGACPLGSLVHALEVALSWTSSALLMLNLGSLWQGGAFYLAARHFGRVRHDIHMSSMMHVGVHVSGNLGGDEAAETAIQQL